MKTYKFDANKLKARPEFDGMGMSGGREFKIVGDHHAGLYLLARVVDDSEPAFPVPKDFEKLCE